jgi:uncharacterized protein YkwD
VKGLDVEIGSAINQIRLRRGLRPLRANSGLRSAAREHTVEMATRKYFGHQSPSGRSVATRVSSTYRDAGSRIWRVGEDLLRSSQVMNGASVVTLWLHSPEHRANLLDRRFVDVGCSAVRTMAAPGTSAVMLVTCDFGERA